MSKADDPNAGEVLQILMERSRVSPEHLAELAGMSRQTIYNKQRGQSWKNDDSRRFGNVFDVPPELFLRKPVDVMLWLIENGRFELQVIDLRDSDQRSGASGCLRGIGPETYADDVTFGGYEPANDRLVVATNGR